MQKQKALFRIQVAAM